MVPVIPLVTARTIVQAPETAVEPAAMKRAGVKSAPVEPAAVKPAISTVETAAMETATSSPAVRRIGEAWLAENSHAEQRSGNAHYPPPFARLGSVVA